MRARIVSLSVGLSMILGSAVAAAEGAPMTPLASTPFVSVTVDVAGNPTKMVVDTGASDTVLFRWFAAAKKFPVSKASMQGRDSGGKSFALTTVSVSTLSIGSHKQSVGSLPVVPTVMPLQAAGIGGMLSPQTFYDKTDVLIDFPKHALAGGADAVEAVKTRKLIDKLPMASCADKPGKKFAIDVTVNGVKGRFYLDTGAQRSVMTEDFAVKLGKRKKTMAERQGVRGKPSVDTLSDMKVTFGKTQIIVPIDVELSTIACAKVDGKLGGDVLSKYALLLNGARSELALYE